MNQPVLTIPDARARTSLNLRLLQAAGPIVRLAELPRRTRVLGWLGPLLITVVAALLRFPGLDHPHAIVFDETYYVKDAFTLDRFGFATQWQPDDEDNVNQYFIQGDYHEMTDEASYVVHGDLGKWIIALGMRLFGADTGLGWRFGVAVAGTLAVLLVGRVAMRLFGSALLATTASLFVAFDGVGIVESRVALLDGILNVFILAGFWALLMDYAYVRRRLARAMATDPNAERDPWGPRIGFRWWLVVAGVFLGLAAGVKWSGFYAAAAIGLGALAFDIAARRAVGVRWPVQGGIMRGGFPAALALVPTTIVVYVATWFSWFMHDGAYMRTWAADQRAAGLEVPRSWLPDTVNSFIQYHLQMADFHTHLTSEHSAASNPFTWLVQVRPVNMYYETVDGAACGAETCVETINSIGNLAVWWLGLVALVVVLWMAFRRGDWRAQFIAMGYAGTWLPWVFFMHRTIFQFYSVVILPFVALALAYVLGLLLQELVPGWRPSPYVVAVGSGPLPVRIRSWRVVEYLFGPSRDSDAASRRIGRGVFVAVIVLVLLVAAFYWPVWTATPISETWYRLHFFR